MSAGYGVDVWATDSVVTGRLVSGPLLVGQALYRRFITPRGTLRSADEANDSEESAYGFDLAEYVGAVGYVTAVQAIPGIMRSEASKDDRVVDVDVTAALTAESDGTEAIEIVLVAALVDEGDSLTLTLSATAGGVKLLFAELS